MGEKRPRMTLQIDETSNAPSRKRRQTDEQWMSRSFTAINLTDISSPATIGFQCADSPPCSNQDDHALSSRSPRKRDPLVADYLGLDKNSDVLSKFETSPQKSSPFPSIERNSIGKAKGSINAKLLSTKSYQKRRITDDLSVTKPRNGRFATQNEKDDACKAVQPSNVRNPPAKPNEPAALSDVTMKKQYALRVSAARAFNNESVSSSMVSLPSPGRVFFVTPRTSADTFKQRKHDDLFQCPSYEQSISCGSRSASVAGLPNKAGKNRPLTEGLIRAVCDENEMSSPQASPMESSSSIANIGNQYQSTPLTNHEHRPGDDDTLQSFDTLTPLEIEEIADAVYSDLDSSIDPLCTKEGINYLNDGLNDSDLLAIQDGAILTLSEPSAERPHESFNASPSNLGRRGYQKEVPLNDDADLSMFSAGSACEEQASTTFKTSSTLSKKDIPIVRPPFPAPVRDRSPIMGLSASLVLRTCFRVGEALNIGCHAARNGKSVMIELYARVTSSWRELTNVKQHFVFCDLFHQHGPFMEGIYEMWKGVELWDYDSGRFLGEVKRTKCRCVGKMRRDDKKWTFEVLNIWEASWEDIDHVKGIVYA